jgi:hypothetical protein
MGVNSFPSFFAIFVLVSSDSLQSYKEKQRRQNESRSFYVFPSAYKDIAVWRYRILCLAVADSMLHRGGLSNTSSKS